MSSDVSLEELQVANDTLQTQVDEMAATRMSAENACNTMAEFAEGLREAGTNVLER